MDDSRGPERASTRDEPRTLDKCPECGDKLRDAKHASKHADGHYPPTEDIPNENILARYRARLLRGEPIDPKLAKTARSDYERAMDNKQ